jgi:ATP-dependent Clp protease ATP-binding subunit ClpA
LISQTDSIVVPALQSLKIDISKLKEEINAKIQQLPTVSGEAQPFAAKELIQVLEKAADEA